MEIKTYGKFEDNFDYYTVEEEAYFGGECVGGREWLRDASFESAITETVRMAMADENNPPNVREEYDWGICYKWTDPGGRMVIGVTGRTN
jgi:hypothetical protein